jgi:hypothetical protein
MTVAVRNEMSRVTPAAISRVIHHATSQAACLVVVALSQCVVPAHVDHVQELAVAICPPQ